MMRDRTTEVLCPGTIDEILHFFLICCKGFAAWELVGSAGRTKICGLMPGKNSCGQPWLGCGSGKRILE